jgi:flagellar assembly protein FliH
MSSSEAKATGPAKAAGASPTYSRFIPREELGSFAAWQPGSIGGAADARAAPAAAQDPKAQLHAARQAGYQDGYRDGLQALDSFKQSFARATSERIGALVDGFDAELLALERQLAAAVADVAAQIARQAVRSELATRPELVVQVAQEALGTLLLAARHVRVHVHPDDQALVADGAGDALQARGARLLADASLTRGGCRIESDIGVVDATVETRWTRALATLGAAPQAL